MASVADRELEIISVLDAMPVGSFFITRFEMLIKVDTYTWRGKPRDDIGTHIVARVARYNESQVEPPRPWFVY